MSLITSKVKGCFAFMDFFLVEIFAMGERMNYKSNTWAIFTDVANSIVSGSN